MAFLGRVVPWEKTADCHVIKVTDVLGSMLAVYFLVPIS